MPRPIRRTDTAPGWINRKFRDLERKIDQAAAAKRLPGSSMVVNGVERPVVDFFGDPQFTQDTFTVTATGTQTLSLTHFPEPNSEHCYWNGLYQPASEWTRAGRLITMPDTSARLRVGDELVFEYAWRDQLAPGDTVAAYPLAVTGAAPYLFYEFENPTASAVTDSSGNGHDTAFTYNPPGVTGLLNDPSGYARQMPGFASQGLAVTVPTPVTAFTAEAVLKDAVSGAPFGMYGSIASNSRWYASVNTDGSLSVRVYDTGANYPTYTTTGVNLNDGQRHQLAVTYDNATTVLNIYVDGVLAGGGTVGASMQQPATSTLYIGIRGADATLPYVGVLDEVAYYTRALTLNEIASHYNSLVDG